MINLKVKTIWQDKAAIRDKYYIEALQNKDLISITHKGEIMVVSPKDMLYRSKHKVKDKFSNDWHYLFYFNWKPINNNQLKLL